MPIIREAHLSEAPLLAEIHIRCWRDTYKGVVSDAYLDAMDLEQRTQRWQQILGTPTNPLAVIEVDGAVVGFFSWGKSRVKGLPNEYELYSLYLLKEYRGQGLGKLAVEHARTQLGESMIVGVLDGNPYKVFYEKLGSPCNYQETVEIGGDSFQEVFYLI